ncbi:hypothetical protein BN1013_02258 [Candidatus Rubidus massiliensis]|nr:hypothetical protein BN1013_02258 [Candidatus Rubidus massiliensis]
MESIAKDLDERAQVLVDPYYGFTIQFLTTIVVAISLITSINFLIDPWNFFQTPKISGLNTFKSELGSQQCLFKARQIHFTKPDSIIIGSSRVMTGLDPKQLQKYTQTKNGFNAGFAGARFDEIYAYFQYALNQSSKLKSVIIGIDLFAFNEKKPPREDFCKERLQQNITFTDLCFSLFNKQTFMASLKTFYSNFNHKAQSVFLENGFSNPQCKEDIAMSDKDLLRLFFQSPVFYKNFSFSKERIDLFKQIVKTCEEKNIDLKVYINPSQDIYWEALCQRGYSSHLDLLKRELAQIFPIWDFSGFNLVTRQEIEGVKNLYSDCSHFTSTVGNLIFEKMFKGSSLPFGKLLTKETVDQQIQEFYEERVAWKENNQSKLNQLENILNNLN